MSDPQTPLGSLQRSRDSVDGFKGALRQEVGKKGDGKAEGREVGKRGEKGDDGRGIVWFVGR